MPTKQYIITILNGYSKGRQYFKYSTYEKDLVVDFLKKLGFETSVKEQSLI